MMTWKEIAAGLGTSALVGELKAIEPQVSKRQYKRLLSTTLAQLLELDPDTNKGRARRWARKATGVKPSKKTLKAAGDARPQEGGEAAPATEAGGDEATDAASAT
jgi:hypothetical protein